MRLMIRFTSALLIVPALAAQMATDVFTKAPPAVEEALRERIQQFYQLHREGKFRQAEALVAEDTKDFFYSSNKPKYVSFKIDRIDWSEEFTKAKATVVCEMFVMVPGFAGKPLPVPTPSTWKVENGQWVWYVSEEARNATPFGQMKPGTGGSGAAPSLPALPTLEEGIRLISRVSADKSSVKLNTAEPSSDQVTITNEMPGAIKISVSAPEVPGLEIQAEPSIEPGGKSIVTFRYKPGNVKPAAPVTATITAENGQSFPVRVEFVNAREKAGQGGSGTSAAAIPAREELDSKVSADTTPVKLNAGKASSGSPGRRSSRAKSRP